MLYPAPRRRVPLPLTRAQAVEYLKRVSPALRLYSGVEGVEDEIEWISEAQLFLRRNVILKLNNAIGLTSKSTDWTPEIGLTWSFK